MEARKKKVAVYALVTSDLDNQNGSCNNFFEECSSKISKNLEWELVNLYSDKDAGSYSLKKRTGFKKMINDAMNGKIDLIITKSISHFLRNVLDFIQITRNLLEKNVVIFFEKENLTTEKQEIKTLLTLLEVTNNIERSLYGSKKSNCDSKA